MAWGIAAALFITGAAVLLVALHLLPTGVRADVDPVGHYGITGYRTQYRVMVVRFGVGGALLAAGLADRTDAGGLLWLWVYAASRVAIAGFMSDRDEPGVSIAGRVHLLLTVAAYGSIALAGTDVTWTGAPAILRTAGHIVAAVAIAALVTRGPPPLRKLSGLADRAFYVASASWLLVAAIALACGS